MRLIIDIGGDDVYRLGEPSKQAKIEQSVSCIVDLSGDDVYTGGARSLACGIGGIGICFDVEGNDTYRTGDFTQGSALFGVGILHDGKGNDSYLAGQNSQAAAAFGIGMLVDLEGQDIYQCHTQGQAFGATRGIGLLYDGSGNDQYLASSPYVDVLRYEAHYLTFTQGAALGYRPIASGGIAILADKSGNDLYATDIYGQGTAYWFGLGAILDHSGEDRYQAYQYAQGSGVHLATGIVHDLDGDDVYVSHGVSQGCGHDIALGALIDEHGNDSYMVESLSLGGGNANAVSLFVDRTGNDAYIAINTKNTLGYSDFRRYQSMIGVFIDGGGTDTYGERDRNDITSLKSTYGAFVDTEMVKDSTPSRPEPTYEDMPLAGSIDSLFIQASAAPLKYQNNVTPARDKIVEMGVEALPDLEVYFGTKMPRERIALEYIIPKLREQDSVIVDEVLQRGLLGDDLTARTLCATVAGKSKATTMIPTLITLTRDSSWKTRRLASLALGRIGDANAVPALRELLDDPHPWVRGRAAYAVAMCAGPESLDYLKKILHDDHQVARYTALEGLRRGKKRDFADVRKVINEHSDPHTLLSSMLLISTVDTTDANVNAVKQYASTVKGAQRTAFERALPLQSTYWREALKP